MAGLLGVPSGNLHTNRVWCAVLLVAPLVFWAPSGPAAREIATREPLARSGRSRSPPWPSGPSGALRTGGACVAVCGGASPRSPARPCRRPWVPQPGPPTPWPCCFVACGTAGVLGAVGPGRVAGLLGVPVGGGPLASRPRCELRSARRLEARPGPAAAHGLRSLALRRPGLAVLLLVAPLVFWAPSGPAAREIATHEPSARSGRSRSPPWPSGPFGALHTGVACVAVCGGASPRSSVMPRPPRDRHTRAFGSEWSISKPARALRTLRRPPHRRRLRRCVWWSFPSKPGQALPPPMGAAGRLSGPSGALHAGGAAGICN